MDFNIRNNNDKWTWAHGYQKVYQEHNQVKYGRITNVRRKNHLALTYDVTLFDTGELIVQGCKVSTSESGFNGVGSFRPLNEGTPVIVAFKNGILQDGIIIGCFNAEGLYKDYYEEGKLQKPGEVTKDGGEFNQTLGHPNRITQEDSYFDVMGGKTRLSPYDSPEYHALTEDRIKSYPMPSSIGMKNQGGDLVNYTLGANVTYSDGNIIAISAGDREEKSSKLLRFSTMHSQRATLIKGVTFKTTSTAEVEGSAGEASTLNLRSSPSDFSLIDSEGLSFTGVSSTAVTKEIDSIIPLVQKNSTSSSGDAINDEYRAAQEAKLAELYAQASKSQNQLTAARQTEAKSIEDEFGNELGTSTDPKQTAPSYSPKQDKATANSNNYGERSDKDVNGNTVSNELVVVLHETVGSADSALASFNNPNSEASYHALIRRDGSVVYTVPPEKRAYGAANSDFNGESVRMSATAPSSVNNFAYHISLESPEDGRGNGATHSGYTEEQYQSLAWLTSRTGVKEGRITSHSVVDNTGERSDPRSFDNDKFNRLLKAYPRQRQMNFGAGVK